ncbi:MAG TPA: hypothetical protein VKZ75_04995 [Cyclobacteriaceae bacterium]|nr:hypothetical protein [Cyclobacteriaceae bacterium]
MIKKSLLTAVVLLLLHALVVYLYPISSTQYASQGNTIKAQRFIYGGAQDNIIIGSSLSNRLVMDSLPGMSNLSFSGMGIFDGLSILNHSNVTPRTMFIETNIMSRSENEHFTSYVNSPLLRPVKKAIPSLRDEYQPIGMLGQLVISMLKKDMAGEEVMDQTATTQQEGDDTFFKKILAIETEKLSKVPDTAELLPRFEQLALEVERLEAKGARVIFFEMPVNEILCDLPQPQAIRSLYRKYFPESKYAYITVPHCSGYRTTDGAHLAGEEATRYTMYFKAHAEALVASQDRLSAGSISSPR